jgi:hypothetical protein
VRIAAASTWVVKAHEDVDICKPCSENDGHEYDTQAAAYADYPGGKGYVKCLGRQELPLHRGGKDGLLMDLDRRAAAVRGAAGNGDAGP